MCGIAGIHAKNGTIDRSLLERLGRALSHRGPDGHGEFVAENTGLAHTRLSIIDLAGGAQPLHNEDATTALVCNGEIYNYVELRRELEALGHRFSTGSDSETLIHAYEAWGPSFLNRLHGMFAFALYDSNTKELLIARDRMGIKPLFLLQTDEAFYFASELKPLLAALPGKPKVNPSALLEFLQNQFISGSHTLMEGMSRVHPGEAIVFRDGRLLKRWIYYRLPVGQRSVASSRELIEQFDALMNDVMREHVRSDVPFGLFLSGGVDSSLLAMLLQKHASRRLRTFSVGFAADGVANELEAALAISKQFDTEHTALTIAPADLLARLPFSIWAADELLGDSACLPTSMLAERAGKELKVVFSGEGGDEVFAGYARYRASFIKRLSRRLRAPRLGGMRASGQWAGAEPLLGERLRQLDDVWQLPQAEAWQSFADAATALQRMQAVDLVTWLPDDLLVKCDRMLMSFAVEGRVPYLDHRVVEFGLALSDARKVDSRFGKLFLREWGQRTIASERMWSRKKGFTVPIQRCLIPPVLAKLATLLPLHPAIREWFAPQRVFELLMSASEATPRARIAWSLLQFAIWHNIFIDGTAARPDTEVSDLASVL